MKTRIKIGIGFAVILLGIFCGIYWFLNSTVGEFTPIEPETKTTIENRFKINFPKQAECIWFLDNVDSTAVYMTMKEELEYGEQYGTSPDYPYYTNKKDYDFEVGKYYAILRLDSKKVKKFLKQFQSASWQELSGEDLEETRKCWGIDKSRIQAAFQSDCVNENGTCSIIVRESDNYDTIVYLKFAKNKDSH